MNRILWIILLVVVQPARLLGRGLRALWYRLPDPFHWRVGRRPAELFGKMRGWAWKKAPPPWFRSLVRAFGAVTVVVTVFGVLAVLVGPVTQMVAGTVVDQIADPKDRAAAINAVRQTLLAASGGSVVLIGLLFTARTFYLVRQPPFVT